MNSTEQKEYYFGDFFSYLEFGYEDNIMLV